MKDNMLKVMEKFKIDRGIRNLVGKLWKHGYKTIHSCEGHPSRIEPVLYTDSRTDQSRMIDSTALFPRFIAYEAGSGDGWFEINAERLGFTERKERPTYSLLKDKWVNGIFYCAENSN